MNANQNPVFETKLRQIRASVFKNIDKNGKPFYNTQVVRRYQSGNDEWSNSSHFTGKADLLLARHLIDESLKFIAEQDEAGGGLRHLLLQP